MNKLHKKTKYIYTLSILLFCFFKSYWEWFHYFFSSQRQTNKYTHTHIYIYYISIYFEQLSDIEFEG